MGQSGARQTNVGHTSGGPQDMGGQIAKLCAAAGARVLL